MRRISKTNPILLLITSLILLTGYAQGSEPLPVAGLVERLAPSYINNIIFERIDTHMGTLYGHPDYVAVFF